MKIIYIIMLLVPSLFAGADAKPIWLSQIPPQERSEQIKTTGMLRLPALKQRGYGSSKLVLWLREGSSIADAEYLYNVDFDSLQTSIISPNSKLVEHNLSNVSGSMELTFEGNEDGFYNVYIVGRKVTKETLNVTTIQSELLNHSCRYGHKHVSRSMGPFYRGNEIPFEIVRKRMNWENFHTVIQSGDVVQYQLLSFGKPISGAVVTLTTHKGWQKTKISDDDGIVSFEFIGEYFGRDKEFHSRDMYHYLLSAEITVSENGELGGKKYSKIKYSGSISEKYRAATEIYTSTIWALIIVVFTIALISGGIFIYRSKSTRKYKEIVFSEKD